MWKYSKTFLTRLIKVGDKHALRRTFTREDVQKYATLVGDENPIHLYDAAAHKAGFPRPLVHGMLVSSLFTNIMGMHLPGPQSVYLKQYLEFRAPVFVDDELEVAVEISQFNEHNHRIHLKTTISKVKDGTLCVHGEALGMNKSVTFEGPGNWSTHLHKF